MPMGSTGLERIAGLDPTKRATAVVAYMSNGEARLAEARVIRDDAIRALRAEGVSRAGAASLAGVSVAHVAAVTGRPKTG